ncbi:unnamed protein product [Gulo gulo]|uniref:Uncharacterized protein n=1 Tax=Gulo gulo TaxID=48420 RepID=A0A9X9LFU1_GULGU|nr:unnamed protein product [Gulo gulo]
MGTLAALGCLSLESPGLGGGQGSASKVYIHGETSSSCPGNQVPCKKFETTSLATVHFVKRK